ncbi:MAG: methionine aminotransferase [Steroidobacteraceae bacterium]
MTVRSKLPDVETTIFTVISRRAAELGALNIGQGFPDYPIDPRLARCVGEAMQEGRNQYAHGDGLPELRRVIAAKLRAAHGVQADPEAGITVTCGGTEALFSAIQALVGPGDEVIVFDPAYDSYDPAVRLAGGRCIHLPLAPPSFQIDFERLRAALTPRTRLVILNTPHNPACVVHDRAALDELAQVLRNHDVRVLSDEVYEHVVFDGAAHASVLAHPELRERSLAVFSFGKTLHVTGWRIGYCVGPPALMAEFRKVHQFNTFTIATPLQAGIARYLEGNDAAWQGLAAFFERKRELLGAALAGSGFQPLRSAGTYFQLLDYSALSTMADVEFADRLIREGGVALIPLSPFYREPPLGARLLRICLAKRDETVELAARRLREFGAALREPVPGRVAPGAGVVA